MQHSSWTTLRSMFGAIDAKELVDDADRALDFLFADVGDTCTSHDNQRVTKLGSHCYIVLETGEVCDRSEQALRDLLSELPKKHT